MARAGPRDAVHVVLSIDGEKMKITMARVLSIREELDSLFMKDMPVKTAWKISKFIRRVESEYNDFEKNRMKILDKYVDKEVGKVPDDKQQELMEEMEDLLDVEVEIEVDTVDISELGDISLPPLAMAKMSFLFDEAQPVSKNGPVPDMSPDE